MEEKLENKIEEHVLDVRDNIVRDRLNGEVEDSSLERDVLYGQCVENAEILSEHLNRHIDADIKIVYGGLDLPKEPTPESYERARLDGTVHHWVSVEPDSGDTYHCNVVREGINIDGRPLVSTRKPHRYIDFGIYDRL